MIKVKIEQLNPLEHDEQVAFVTLFGRVYPHVRIFAIPNGTRSSMKAAVKAKREGCFFGCPGSLYSRLESLGRNEEAKGFKRIARAKRVA